MMMAPEPFVFAEMEYRLNRTRAQFGPARPRRHRVRRRPTLRLPRRRPRPLSVA